ncbi:MAG: NAD-dependent epimerase/dehydratase family protein [Xanthomonadales bacterium]|nr:NAD-dependent epimerase/dehydratase family protein [Xanthomonadales bacterium]
MDEPSPQPALAVQPARGPVLVLGGSGLVGAHLVRQLAAAGVPVHATTRASAPPPALANLAHWHCGPAFSLETGEGPWPDLPMLASAGPLAALPGWLRRVAPSNLQRLVALGSTSEAGKRDSPDPAERALAARLHAAQEDLATTCDPRHIAWTVLRPTLIWGDGRDRNLSRLAALARRLPCLPVPTGARGGRQPIHARQVATAVAAAMATDHAAGRALDLPGAETMPYHEMARRVAAAVAPPGRVCALPGLVWTARVAAAFGLAGRDLAAVLARCRQDLVFDRAPARALLGLRDEPFRPTAEDFPGA